MSRAEIDALTRRLHDAQQRATQEVLEHADFDTLGHETADGFTVNDTLRMWVWHSWSHQRELVLARGRLTGDNPHSHVPHYVRQAYEEFGRFVGELAAMTDEQLELRLPGEGRSAREIVEHVLETLEGYVPDQVKRAEPPKQGGTACRGIVRRRRGFDRAAAQRHSVRSR